MKYPLPCWRNFAPTNAFLQKVPNYPTEGFGKAAWLPIPRNAQASGNGHFSGTSILIYFLNQLKFIVLSKVSVAPSSPRWATASRLSASWVRHGVGNHGKDIHWQLGRVIGNSSMLSSARGPRWVSRASDWHEGPGLPHSRAFRAPHCPPRWMSACAGADRQRSTDTMCICKC